MIQFTRVICLLCVLSVLSVVYGFVAPGRTRSGPNFCRGVCTKLPELHMVAVVPFAIPVALPGAVGEIASKINISSIQAKRIFNLSALTAVFIAFRSKISSAFTNGSKNMESGWKKRGDGSAAQRTIEVYTFAISFAFKFVSSLLPRITYLQVYVYVIQQQQQRQQQQQQQQQQQHVLTLTLTLTLTETLTLTTFPSSIHPSIQHHFSLRQCITAVCAEVQEEGSREVRGNPEGARCDPEG